MKVDYGVHIDERKIFKTLKEARLMVEDSIKQHYAKLWDYAIELTRTNKGIIVVIDIVSISREPP